MCEVSIDITGLDNKCNGGRFSFSDEVKIVLILVGHENDTLR